MGPKQKTLALSIAATLAGSPMAQAADKAACLEAYESAQQHKNAGKLRSARAKLLVCVQPECPALLRTDCSAWMGEVERGMPTVVVVARSGDRELTDVQLFVDDEPLAQSLTGTALEVDPGERVFRLEAAGHAPLTRSVSVRQGEKDRRLLLALVPLAGSRGTQRRVPTMSWVLGGVGALGLAGFSYFGLKGLSGRSDLEDCKGECEQGDVDDVRADFTRADVSLAIAALGFGGAAYFYFTAPGEESGHAARVGILPRAGGATTAIQLRF